MPSLFDPVRLGELSLSNRIVMAPLTRNRAVEGQVPSPLAPTYYAQRASAGLIVSEGTQVSATGIGYVDTPGIYSPAQVAGWRRVTEAVHAAGGRIVAQLWHVGRISHVSLLPPGELPVAPSVRPAQSKTYLREGFTQVSAPRALRTDELPGIVAQFRHAARCAVDAGFDGVEVHSANGYLLDQFLRDSLNARDDAYGGSIANRARLLIEVMQAVSDEIGAGRVGVRLSPVTPSNDAAPDSDPTALYAHVVDRLASIGLAFLHVVEGATGGPRDVAPFDYAALRAAFPGAYIANNGYTRDMALEAVASGQADLVSFGRPFISNPDLVRRLRENAPWAPGQRETYYGGGAAGYIDYPALDGSAVSV